MTLYYQSFYDLKTNIFNFAWSQWYCILRYSFNHGLMYNSDLYTKKKKILKIIGIF